MWCKRYIRPHGKMSTIWVQKMANDSMAGIIWFYKPHQYAKDIHRWLLRHPSGFLWEVGSQAILIFCHILVLVSAVKLLSTSMNYSTKSHTNENTNEWTCCINMLNTCTPIAWWSPNAKHTAAGKENREKLKEQQNQHNKHRIKGKWQNTDEKLSPKDAAVGCRARYPETQLGGHPGSDRGNTVPWVMEEDPVNEGDLHGKSHVSCIHPN